MAVAEEWSVQLLLSALDDLQKLSKTDQKRVVKEATKLQRAPLQLGEPLGNHQGQDLTGLRRLRVGHVRVVYRCVEFGKRVEILSVAAREGERVYQVAAARETGKTRLRRVI